MAASLCTGMSRAWVLVVVALVTAGMIAMWAMRGTAASDRDGASLPTEQRQDSSPAGPPASDGRATEPSVADVCLPEHPAGDRHVDKGGGIEASIEQYESLAAALDEELAAYRASMPVFAEFIDVSINKMVPLAIEGENARIWLLETNERGLHDYDQGSRYDKQKAEEAIAGILGTIYGGVYQEVQKAIEAGRLRWPDEQNRIYYLACSHRFRNVTTPLSEPFEAHYPYDEGTLEHQLFRRDLGQAAVMAMSPLKKMMSPVPSELAEKQRQLDESYEKLVRWQRQFQLNVALPPRYREGSLRRLDEELQRVDRVVELHQEAKQLQNEGLKHALDGLDADIRPGQEQAEH